LGFCVGFTDFAVNFLLLSLPVQVIAWRTVSEMTYNVSCGTLNFTHSLTPFFCLSVAYRFLTRKHKGAEKPKSASTFFTSGQE